MLEPPFWRNHEKYSFWCKWTCQFVSNRLYCRCIIFIIQFHLCTFFLSFGKLGFFVLHYICLFICLIINMFIHLSTYLIIFQFISSLISLFISQYINNFLIVQQKNAKMHLINYFRIVHEASDYYRSRNFLEEILDRLFRSC